jgi:hypothetical protein
MARRRSSCSPGRPGKTRPDFVACPVATRFWQQGYRPLCAAEFPDLLLHLQPSQSDKKYTWPEFRHPALMVLRARLYHKPEPQEPAEPGHLDVEFVGRTVEQLRNLLGEDIPADAQLVSHGRSASLRIDVPKLFDHLPFERQVLDARVVFAQARHLLAFSAGRAATQQGHDAAWLP